VGEYFSGKLSAVAHQEFVKEKIHQTHVSGISHGLVVDVSNLAMKRFANRPEPT
jgi:hypothetical protein